MIKLSDLTMFYRRVRSQKAALSPSLPSSHLGVWGAAKYVTPRFLREKRIEDRLCLGDIRNIFDLHSVWENATCALWENCVGPISKKTVPF